MTKLNFFDAVLNRLARAEHAFGDVGRGVFFVADEYDGYTTQPGDGDFFSKCREAKCCAVIATQTYESFVAKLQNEHVAAQLIADLRTKIWLCAEDNYTARQAADLCGEIERKKVSRSRNESARHSSFSFLAATSSLQTRARWGRASPSVSAGSTCSRPRLHEPQCQPGHREAVDGVRVLEPWVVYLKPMHGNPRCPGSRPRGASAWTRQPNSQVPASQHCEASGHASGLLADACGARPRLQ